MTEITLNELLARTEKNAHVIKEFDSLQRAAQAKLNEVRAHYFFPNFSLKAYTGAAPDARFNPNNLSDFKSGDLENDFSLRNLGPFIRLEIEAIQPLYTFGKISNLETMATHGLELAQLEKQKKGLELRHWVKESYYTLQLAHDSFNILQEVEQKLQDANSKVEELLIKNAENVLEVDRFKIRVFLADVQKRKLDAERAKTVTRSALEEMSGITGNWVLQQKELAAETMEGLKKEEIIQKALAQKPELNQLTQLISIKEAEHRALRAELFPTLFIGGQANYAYAPDRDNVKNPYLKDNFNYVDIGAALGLKQDLSILKTLSKMGGYQAEIDRLQAQKEQFIAKVRIKTGQSWEEAWSAHEAIKINENGFRAARSWLTSSGLSFSLGTSDTKDVLESFAAYFKARADLSRSFYNLNMALAELSQEAGVEVVERLR